MSQKDAGAKKPQNCHDSINHCNAPFHQKWI
jgi:hypothetical protein